MTTLILDGDLLAYRSAISCEEVTEWDDNLFTLHADANVGINKLSDNMSFLKEKFNATRMVVALSSRNNFRKTIEPTYKSNRKKTRKPIIYTKLLEWFYRNIECFSFEGLEGDDIMGIFATSEEFKNEDVILVSSDKDMRTIPAKICGLEADDKIEVISQKDADYWFMIQTLTGDVTDGYSGCPKVGKVTAQKLLANVKHDIKLMWEIVKEAYAKADLDEEYAIRQSQLARILRQSDWDSNSRTPILWRPENA